MNGEQQVAAPDKEPPLQLERIVRLLQTRWIGKECVCLSEVVSTSDEAISMAQRGCGEGTVVVADSQSGGRGRHGRKWVSPAGSNLYFSLVLRPPWEASDLPPLSLVVALALGRGLSRLLPRPPTVKWPNDLLCGGKKIAGILLEMSSEGRRIPHLVIGVGVNVNQQHFARPIEEIATSIRLQTGQRADRGQVLALLLGELERHVERLYRGQRAALLHEWEQMADWIGAEVEVRNGQARVRGVAEGVDDDGALLLRQQAGAPLRVLAGDLFFR